jgi:acetoin utilization protein AcuB
MGAVKDIMSTNVSSVRPNATLNVAEVLAEARHVRHLPVVDEAGQVVGMVSLRDMLSHFSKAGVSHFVPVKDLMSTPVISISPEASFEELASCMHANDISAVPVVGHGALLGIVTERDFLKPFLA